MIHKYKGDIIIFLTTILAAAGWVFSKEAIQGLPPILFIGSRFIIAALFLVPFCFQNLVKTPKSDVLSALKVGMVLASAIFCWIYAISISDTLGEGAFIMSLSMLFVPIVSWVMFGSRPARLFWLSLPIAVVGLFLMSYDGSFNFESSQLLFLSAAIFLAIHFNLNSKFASSIPALTLTTIQLFSAGIVGVILSALFETWPTSISSDTIKWFALSVLLATSIRYVMQTVGQKHAQPTSAAILMLLEPVFTVLLSIWIYSEEMPPTKILGCSLLLFSLLLYRLGGTWRQWFKRVR
ncbi:DMT family transporter [Vibrio agarivorans]|uniref:DMT family transporter n=1 Tax=Vibrio agarivorans TaxID=153622 RepID=A0ABT7Y4W6_9VIBR|nr:DMT family transporter [Vibrio agarivorans]MDN2483081.1 DMT family transporter [Vibrio agarivorans]